MSPSTSTSVFPNKNPWVSKEVQILLRNCNLAFRFGGRVEDYLRTTSLTGIQHICGRASNTLPTSGARKTPPTGNNGSLVEEPNGLFAALRQKDLSIIQ